MDNKSRLERLIQPYRKRHLMLNIWDGVNTGLMFSLVPAILIIITGSSLIGFLLFIPAISIGVSVVLLRRRVDYRSIDCETGACGEIVTLSELITRKEKNPYQPLLFKRVEKNLERKPAEKCIPSEYRKRTSRTLLLLLVIFTVFILPRFFTPGGSEYQEILRKSKESLIEASEQDSEIVTLAEMIEEFSENLGGLPDYEEEAGEIERLTEELTEQIHRLERNTMNRFFEERGDVAADAVERLTKGEMSLPEARELIIDLLSDPAVDEKTAEAVRKSFRDFSKEEADQKAPSAESQKKFADDLVNNLVPEDTGLSRQLKELLEDLEELDKWSREAAEDSAPSQNEQVAGDPGESPGTADRKSTAESDHAIPEKSVTTAGSGTATRQEEDVPFEPWNEELQEAKLPEGEILERRDQGILRLEGSESFRLERLSSEYKGETNIEEEEIPLMSIPEKRRSIVRDYFTSIGSWSGE